MLYAKLSCEIDAVNSVAKAVCAGAFWRQCEIRPDFPYGWEKKRPLRAKFCT
jgi:hypothetical protein